MRSVLRYLVILTLQSPLLLVVLLCPLNLSRAKANSLSVSAKELSIAIEERIDRVPELKFIREQAKKRGIKVYLFGGTASAFAHYVRFDLLREAGDQTYQAYRFDYDFTNIYRPNQDLDIVIDGPPEQADQIREELQRMFPHFQGDREAWELRLLREKVGDKQPLLDNPDFLNQHTDSNSVGMIDLSEDA